MSITYDIAVPAENWPSFAQINALIAARGYRLEVLPQEGQSADDPMGELGGFLSFLARFRGEDMEMDCYHIVVEEPDAEERNEILEDIGSDYRMSAGAHNWTFGFGPRTPDVYLAPYWIIAGVLVLDCGGYGYEGQAPSFGRADWARDLLREADRIIAHLDRPSQPAPAPETTPPPVVPTASEAEPPRGTASKRRIPINIWTILAAVLVLLLLAEFVDKNIWNFTGTGGSQ